MMQKTMLWSAAVISLLAFSTCMRRGSDTSSNLESVPNADASSPINIVSDFTLDTPNHESIHCELLLTEGAFTPFTGQATVTLRGASEALKSAGLTTFVNAQLVNSGQATTCQNQRCAAFFHPTSAQNESFDFLISVQEGNSKSDPRVLLSWRGNDGSYTTSEAEINSIHWTSPAKSN